MLGTTFLDPMLANAEMVEACPDLITCLRAAVTVDSMGGPVYDFTVAPTVVASDVPANVQTVTPRESENFLRRGIAVSHKIFCPTGIATRIGDRITDTSVSSSPQRYYLVTWLADMGGQHAAFKIFCNVVE